MALALRLRRWFFVCLLAFIVSATAEATPSIGDDFDHPPELVSADGSSEWRTFGSHSEFKEPSTGEFRLGVDSDSESAGFKRVFRQEAAEGRAYILTATIKVDGDERATARLWARVDNAQHQSVALSNQGNAPVRSGSGWQEASVVIYVPPGPFTLNLGGLVNGRARTEFRHFRVALRIPPEDSAIAPEARSYLRDALERVEQISLLAPPRGWPELKQWALTQAAGARTIADTYPALQLALQRLQDRHSSFNLPAQRSASAPSNASGPSNQAAAFGGEPGVLAIPSFMDRSEGAFERFAANLRGALELKVRERNCGLVIDLRDNGGGNMWPMLVGISSLFPDQELGEFVDPAKRTQTWAARDGIIYLADRPVLASVAGARFSQIPVAVLIGPGTASSGEAVAIALRSRPRTILVGSPTADYVTANRTVILRDGAYIAVSSSRMADSAGHIQDGPVQPALRASGPGSELDVARDWIETQCHQVATNPV